MAARRALCAAAAEERMRGGAAPVVSGGGGGRGGAKRGRSGDGAESDDSDDEVVCVGEVTAPAPPRKAARAPPPSSGVRACVAEGRAPADTLPPAKPSMVVDHYASITKPGNPSGFWSRAQRMLSHKKPAQTKKPRQRFCWRCGDKPPMGNYYVSMGVQPCCSGGELVMDKTSTGSATAYGETAHAELSALVALINAGKPLVVAKMFRFSCPLCIRTLQAASRAFHKPTATASYGENLAGHGRAHLYFFDREAKCYVVRLGVMDRDLKCKLLQELEGGRMEEAESIIKLLDGNDLDEDARKLYERAPSYLRLGYAAKRSPTDQARLLTEIHFGILAAEYGASVERGGPSPEHQEIVRIQRERILGEFKRLDVDPQVAHDAAIQLTTPLVRDSEWSSWSGTPAPAVDRATSPLWRSSSP